MSDVVLDVRGAFKRYDTRTALDGCSLQVPQGRVCALVGLNGSGKTTLMKAASGLIPLDDGSITVAGEPVVFGAPPRMSYLAQNKPLPGSLRVREVVGYARELAGGNLDLDVVDPWLEEEAIPSDQLVGELSGGQRTQVALALTVARTAAMLALDEPMADLDPLARERVSQRLLKVAGTGRTILVSSHAVAELGSWCDFLVVIDSGHSVECTSIADTSDVRTLETRVLELLRAAQTARAGARRGREG